MKGAAPTAMPDSGDPDAILASRAQRGDREAFGTLYDRLSPLLLGTARRIAPGHREADDLVHDVFLEAWAHIRQYDPARGTVRTWFLLRLRSRALDRLGRAEARTTEPVAEIPEPRVPLPPLDAVEGIAVRTALAQLDPDVRRVLEDTYVGGLTAKEIAERTSVPLGTVKSRLARGLERLSALLAEGAPHE